MDRNDAKGAHNRWYDAGWEGRSGTNFYHIKDCFGDEFMNHDVHMPIWSLAFPLRSAGK
jgi:hypothetical protein